MSGTHDVVSLIFLLAHVLSLRYYAGICCQDFLNSSQCSPLHATLCMQPWAYKHTHMYLTHTHASTPCETCAHTHTRAHTHTDVVMWGWWRSLRCCRVWLRPTVIPAVCCSSPHGHWIWHFSATVPTHTRTHTRGSVSGRTHADKCFWKNAELWAVSHVLDPVLSFLVLSVSWFPLPVFLACRLWLADCSHIFLILPSAQWRSRGEELNMHNLRNKKGSSLVFFLHHFLCLCSSSSSGVPPFNVFLWFVLLMLCMLLCPLCDLHFFVRGTESTLMTGTNQTDDLPWPATNQRTIIIWTLDNVTTVSASESCSCRYKQVLSAVHRLEGESSSCAPAFIWGVFILCVLFVS